MTAHQWATVLYTAGQRSVIRAALTRFSTPFQMSFCCRASSSSEPSPSHIFSRRFARQHTFPRGCVIDVLAVLLSSCNCCSLTLQWFTHYSLAEFICYYFWPSVNTGSWFKPGEFQWTRNTSFAVSSAQRSNAYKWGFVLVYKAYLLSFSDIFQQNLVLKCIFSGLTVV